MGLDFIRKEVDLSGNSFTVDAKHCISEVSENRLDQVVASWKDSVPGGQNRNCSAP